MRSDEREIEKPTAASISHLRAISAKKTKQTVGFSSTAGNVRGPLKVIAHNHTQVDLTGYNLNRLIVKVVRVSWRVAFPRYPEQERLIDTLNFNCQEIDQLCIESRSVCRRSRSAGD